MNTKRKKLLPVLLLLCTVFLFACVSPVKHTEVPPEKTAQKVTEGFEQTVMNSFLSVYFLKAGKADAILIRTKDRNYLLDTGLESSLPAVFGALKRLDVKELDAIFCTHTHDDHIGGLEALLLNMPVGRVYRSAISENKKNGKNKIDSKADGKVELLNAGDVLPVGDGIFFEVLGPVTENGDDDNDNSLILKLTAGKIRYLFTGDMQFPEENTLLDAEADLSADVLKVGNHGNPDAGSEDFLRAVNPPYAVVTTDRSVDPDSANPMVLERLKNADIRITDKTEAGVCFVQPDAETLICFEPECRKGTLLPKLSVQRQEKTVKMTAVGEDADISEYMLMTESGNGFFKFPEGTLLKKGSVLTVSGKKESGDFTVDEKKPFSEKNGKLLLFDPYGNMLQILD